MSTVSVAFEKAAAGGPGRPGRLPSRRVPVGGRRGEAAVAIAQAGADVIEIGLPYSDPLMDGPVIQEATQRALAGGTHVTDVMRTVAAVAPRACHAGHDVLESGGALRRRGFARDLAAAGGAGVITPDLPPEEAGDWLEAADACGLDRVFLVAPSSSDARIERITADCRGFVYAASLMGTTGARDSVGAAAAGLVSRVREATSLPVAVGLGVRDGAQAAEVAGFADGVIVGSAFVQRLLAAPDAQAGLDSVRELAAELAAGVRAPAS